MLILISILICNEYFHVAKIISARKILTVCNIKPKAWSYISGLGVWVIGSGSSMLASLSWVLDLESQFVGSDSWSWFLDSRSWDKSLRSQALGLSSFSDCHKVWQNVITICDRYYQALQLLQSATENYYNVWQALQSVIKKLLESITTITTSDFKIALNSFWGWRYNSYNEISHSSPVITSPQNNITLCY